MAAPASWQTDGVNPRPTRISVLAMGSRGDVQPFVALASGLSAAGMDVGITVPQDLVPIAASRGLRTETFGVDVQQASGKGAGLEWQAEGSRSLRQEGKLLKEMLAQLAEPIAEGVLDTSEHADLVISGAMTFDAASVATRARGQRHIVGMLAPTSPGRRGSSTVYAALPGTTTALNKAASTLAAAAAYSVFNQPANIVGERLGLPTRSLREYLHTAYATPSLLACSPAIVPPDSSWGEQLRATGYWVLPTTGWQPPKELVEFLDSGAPPVYLGFGSMMSRNPGDTTRIILDALDRTSQRGLVSTGWTGLRADDLPDTVALVDDVPHEWLFPRVSAVVHHGGAGTTAAAVRAGVPQLVVPHVGDQPYWGRRVTQLGLGPAPIKRHDLEVARLAARMRRMTTDARMRKRAADLGAIVRSEDGVATAVELIAGYVGATG